jgi:hypothetical protein
MPLYHFQVIKGNKTVDPKAIDLPDVEAARHHERIADGLSVMNTGFGLGSLCDWQVQVTDRKRRPIVDYKISKMAHASASRSNVQRKLRA